VRVGAVEDLAEEVGVNDPFAATKRETR